MLEAIVDKARNAYQRAYCTAAEAWHELNEQPWNRTLTIDSTVGAERAQAWRDSGRITQQRSDKMSMNAYSIIVGGFLDIFGAGMTPTGLALNRTIAFVWNSLTGGVYGKYRDVVFQITKTTTESSKRRQFAADFFAFYTFQVPTYAAAISTTLLITKGHIDLERIKDGMVAASLMSPFISPTTNWTLDKSREYCGLETSAEKAYQALQGEKL
ncbi:L-alanine exporter AlaE [Candidatus Woesearchaeota archaeon]|nr:L-alanine exporter AlaE [Candidatus Woesearchaeota archaeon]